MSCLTGNLNDAVPKSPEMAGAGGAAGVAESGLTGDMCAIYELVRCA